MALIASCLLGGLVTPVIAAEPIDLKFSRAELEAHWRTRIESLLDQGKLPKIDMETSIKQKQVADYIPDVFETMDELGIALFGPAPQKWRVTFSPNPPYFRTSPDWCCPDKNGDDADYKIH